MTQPTPGPWFASEHTDADCWIVATAPILRGYRRPPPGALELAVMADDGLAPGVPEANARLIAAAPDLLAALREAERELHNPSYGGSIGLDVAEMVRAALAKATP